MLNAQQYIKMVIKLSEKHNVVVIHSHTINIAEPLKLLSLTSHFPKLTTKKRAIMLMSSKPNYLHNTN